MSILDRLRRLLWVALLLPLGAALAFLSLEFIGLPLVLITLVLIVLVGRRAGNVPALLGSFGAGFVVSVSYFAIRVGIFSGEEGLSGTVWFATQFAFGVAMIALGWGLFVRSTHPEKL